MDKRTAPLPWTRVASTSWVLITLSAAAIALAGPGPARATSPRNAVHGAPPVKPADRQTIPAGTAKQVAGTSHGSDSSGGPAGPRGLAIPDVPLLDQDGQKVLFYRDAVKGKVVAINFIFTTCTTICPPMGANFAKLQSILGQTAAGRDVRLISITVDPVTDTPGRLKAWADQFHRELHRQPGWSLYTGDVTTVFELLKALQVYTPDKGAHTALVLIGNDSTGEWDRANGLAPPAKLAEIIMKLAQGESRE